MTTTTDKPVAKSSIEQLEEQQAHMDAERARVDAELTLARQAEAQRLIDEQAAAQKRKDESDKRAARAAERREQKFREEEQQRLDAARRLGLSVVSTPELVVEPTSVEPAPVTDEISTPEPTPEPVSQPVVIEKDHNVPVSEPLAPVQPTPAVAETTVVVPPAPAEVTTPSSGVRKVDPNPDETLHDEFFDGPDDDTTTVDTTELVVEIKWSLRSWVFAIVAFVVSIIVGLLIVPHLGWAQSYQWAEIMLNIIVVAFSVGTFFVIGNLADKITITRR